MAPDQDKNWCVTFPLWDYVMGTRLHYKGTDREKLDIERKLRKAEVLAKKTNRAGSGRTKRKKTSYRFVLL
jgi:sterol desaturase/sphingolipid hydroxylase (fatty acid hydroxylase superfamily)